MQISLFPSGFCILWQLASRWELQPQSLVDVDKGEGRKQGCQMTVQLAPNSSVDWEP